MLAKKYVCSKYSDQHTTPNPQITVFDLHQKHYCLTNYSSLHNRFNPEWSFWQVSWELNTIKIIQTSIKVFDRKKSWGTTISQVCLRICFFWYQSDSFNMKRTSLNQSKSIGHFKTTPNQNTKNFQKDVLVTFHLWFELSSF